MSGCPSHTATLDYQSVTDYLVFDDGKGNTLGGHIVEFEKLLSMLKELGGYRVEISSMLDGGLLDAKDN